MVKTLTTLLLAFASVAAWAGSDDSASAPAGKPAMRAMSPKTSPDVAVPGPASADEVWVNTITHVYHCPGNRWYGRTPRGAYMSEVDAKAKGYRPEAKPGCS